MHIPFRVPAKLTSLGMPEESLQNSPTTKRALLPIDQHWTFF